MAAGRFWLENQLSARPSRALMFACQAPSGVRMAAKSVLPPSQSPFPSERMRPPLKSSACAERSESPQTGPSPAIEILPLKLMSESHSRSQGSCASRSDDSSPSVRSPLRLSRRSSVSAGEEEALKESAAPRSVPVRRISAEPSYDHEALPVRRLSVASPEASFGAKRVVRPIWFSSVFCGWKRCIAFSVPEAES